ncbi:MAG: methionyl-tRNA formyltransferase, partial [Buchnera aphidicola]|nr:methionyl-tRNA formyltransferase [Buchnera aphidicola]
KLIKIGIPALLHTIYNIINKKIKKHKQNEKNILLSKKIHKKDALLNWNMPAEKIEKIIRAFNPWPICYFLINKYHIKVWQANVIHKNNKNYNIGEILEINKNGIQINTCNKILNIQKLQLPGKKISEIQDLLMMKKQIFVPGMILS